MGLIENAREAFKIAQSLGNIELQNQILELQQQALQLVAANRDLKDEVARMNEAMATSGELTVRDNAYFQASGGGQEDGPFCTRCWAAPALNGNELELPNVRSLDSGIVGHGSASRPSVKAN